MIRVLYFGLFRLGLGTSALKARGRFTPLFLLDLECYTLSQHYTHRYYYLENGYLPSRTQPTCSTCFSRWLICRQLLPARRNVFFAFGISRHTYYFSRASVCQYYIIIVYNIVTELNSCQCQPCNTKYCHRRGPPGLWHGCNCAGRSTPNDSVTLLYHKHVTALPISVIVPRLITW